MAVRGTALVTGAAKRIGRAVALKLADAGFDVAVHYGRSEAEAQALADEIAAKGRAAALVKADLTKEAEVERVVAKAASALGPVSVLVNNASTFRDDRAMTMTRAGWDAHMETNLRAPLVLAQSFARQAPDGASIVNIVDQRVWKPNPQFFSYSLSKAGLWFATRTLAQALAPKIRVNAVGPGPTLASIWQSPDDFAAEAGGTLLERGASPEEIAAAVLFLVDSPAVTGQMIAVDGGQHLAWRTPDVLEP
ncbi:SDR family oxidoreductase [Caulobacter sp. 17J80-11]|uniref:SDR family oxidoreductase n=1 Tax=Caulobacter sp. 17J80-11 TaxID=2763502 RepID=UPI001653E4E7|nr:SDR family oxidoreductase [Caulobacter sp. 17J80-11]